MKTTPTNLADSTTYEALRYAISVLREDRVGAVRDYGIDLDSAALKWSAETGSSTFVPDPPAPVFEPRVNVLAVNVSEVTGRTGKRPELGEISLSVTLSVYASSWNVSVKLTGDPHTDVELLRHAFDSLDLYYWTFYPQQAEDLTRRVRASRSAGREPSPAELLGQVARVADAPSLSISEDELRDIFREED